MSIIQGVGSGEVSTGFYSYSIDNSLRFNGSTSFLARTPSSTGNRKTFTYSCWFKIGDPSQFQVLLGAGDYDGGAGAFRLVIGGTGRILLEDFNQPGGSYNLRWNIPDTQMVLLDPGSWSNAVLSIDTTPSTPVIKLFINGTDITSEFTNKLATPSQNDQLFISISGEPIRVGYDQLGNKYHNGYLQECVYLDGTAVSDASDFGEIKGDIWIPKNYSGGSFGTNGFRLEFKQSGTGTASASTVGADTSGNNNHMTSTDIDANDQMSDSCTNNHCTLNPRHKYSGSTVSDGNLVVTHNSSGGDQPATFALPSAGKWYWEFKTTNANDRMAAGIKPVVDALSASSITTGYHYFGNTGQFFTDTTGVAYGNTFGQNDVIGVLYNADDNEIEFYVNNNPQSGGAKSIVEDEYYPNAASAESSVIEANFGAKAFAHTPPTGYEALNTANLADPEIDPNDDETPDQYMDTVVYTPNNGTLSVTGLAFTPDWVWIKVRNTDLAHAWFDSVRGTASAGASDNKAIGSNRHDAEGNTNGVLSSFDSGGFTVAGGSSSSNPRSLVNKGTTANDYVAWCWKAGGAPTVDNSAGVGATPTAGSVKIDGANLGSALAGTLAATRLSANTESGFSIVTFTLQASGSKTVAHGLSSAPEMIIFKSRSNATGWIIQHAGVADSDPFTDFINFNSVSNTTAGGVVDNATVSDDTAPTNSVFTIGSGFTTGNYGANQIAYCFHSVDGFSKFAHYFGNGTTPGTFVFTGFRPAFVMIKSVVAGERWNIFDNGRSQFNTAQEILFPDKSVVESTGTTNGPQLFSNGFQVNGNVGNWNHSGVRYFYMAFADQPFKYSNAK